MNTQLTHKIFRPENEAIAVIFTVHGMEEHQGRYAGFARYMNQNGYAVITYDLPGHGRKAGRTGDLGWFGESGGWNRLISSAVEITEIARQEFPGLPVIYYGHSMGTMIGRCYLQNYDFMIDAMVLSGPPSYNSGAGAGKQMALRIARMSGKRSHSATLDGLATGSFNSVITDPRTNVDWLSYNEENVDRYIADPLCGVPFTVQGYYDLFDGMIRMNDTERYYMMNPDLPVLFLAGEDDPCIGGEAGFRDSISLLQKTGYRRVDSIVYPHMRHEILQEKDAEEVLSDIVKWLDVRFAK